MKTVLEWLLSNPAAVLGAIVLLVATVKGPGFLSEYLADMRVQKVLQAARIAFGAVQEMARLTKTTADDKVALFLAKLTDSLIAMGQAPPSPEETQLARNAADGWHADSKLVPTLARAA